MRSASGPGLADPGPVVGALWTDAELEAGVALDGVVVVADARNLGRQLAAAREPGAVNEAARQLAYADVVLLNKVGACSNLSYPARISSVREAVHHKGEKTALKLRRRMRRQQTRPR